MAVYNIDMRSFLIDWWPTKNPLNREKYIKSGPQKIIGQQRSVTWDHKRCMHGVGIEEREFEGWEYSVAKLVSRKAWGFELGKAETEIKKKWCSLELYLFQLWYVCVIMINYKTRFIRKYITANIPTPKNTFSNHDIFLLSISLQLFYQPYSPIHESPTNHFIRSCVLPTCWSLASSASILSKCASADIFIIIKVKSML